MSKDETTAELRCLTDTDLLLVIIKRMDNVTKRLEKLERIGDLVDNALRAVTLESQNRVAIERLDHRVSLLENPPHEKFDSAVVPPKLRRK